MTATFVVIGLNC